MKLWTKEVEIFLHFHTFLHALSGIESLLIPQLTNLKKQAEPPVVNMTELKSMSSSLQAKVGYPNKQANPSFKKTRASQDEKKQIR